MDRLSQRPRSRLVREVARPFDPLRAAVLGDPGSVWAAARSDLPLDDRERLLAERLLLGACRRSLAVRPGDGARLRAARRLLAGRAARLRAGDARGGPLP